MLMFVGIAALLGSLAIERPERFAITLPSALLTIVLGAGAIAADSVPRRPLPLVCSIATVALGLALLIGRGEIQIPTAAAIVALQLAALADRHRS